MAVLRRAIGLSAISGAVILAAAFGGASVRSRGLPQAGRVVGTLPFSLHQAEVFTARNGSLFALVFSENSHSVSILRWGPGGSLARRQVPFRLAYYLCDLSAGADGVYAGTCVIQRFTSAPDRLLRIDPKSLAIRARAYFRGSVITVEQDQGMWATIGDGRVVRLDPRTLATEASRQVISRAAASSRAVSVSKPALGLGSLWVLAGNEADLELVRMAPVSLAVRSRTRIPTHGDLYQALNSVIADARHVYVVGSAIVAVGASGKLIGRPVLVPDLATADIRGTGFVGLTAAPPSLVLLDAHGRIRARTALHDAGAQLAVSGDDAWFLGDAGRGNGIVHVRLNRLSPPPSS